MQADTGCTLASERVSSATSRERPESPGMAVRGGRCEDACTRRLARGSKGGNPLPGHFRLALACRMRGGERRRIRIHLLVTRRPLPFRRAAYRESSCTTTFKGCRVTTPEAIASAYEEIFARSDNRNKPQIVVRQELVAVTDEAIAALRTTESGIYVRGRIPVHLGKSDGLEDPETRVLQSPGAPVILQLTRAALRDKLDRAANWVKCTREGLKSALPPAWVTEQVLARTGWPFPPLEGVVATPVLRPDGTLLDTPGYDSRTGLFYEPVETTPALPNQPTREQVETATRSLLEPVREFPFTDATARAAYLGAVLSLVGRYGIHGPVPAFAITSPTPGTGKGLLAGVIATIGTGRPPAVMSEARDNDELRKRILAIGLAGTPVVLLDNLTGVLGSDVLAAALTAETWSDRLLGVSTVVETPLRTVWIFTGNNLSFKRTLGRRVVPICLDAGVEHPEDRRFEIGDLAAYIKAVRPSLVAAALTVLRAYAQAGRPRHERPRMGSFESWDDWIRGACVWVGIGDPAEADDPTVGRGKIRESLDEDLEALGALLATLAFTFADRPFTAAEVAERAKTDSALRDALEAVGAMLKGQVTARAIGYRFRAAESRIVDGRKLITRPRTGHSKVSLWCVNGNGHAVAGDAGNAGDLPSEIERQKRDDLVAQRLEISPASPALPADPETEMRAALRDGA